jgi:hypothetical protein
MFLAAVSAAADKGITYIRFEKPKLDLIGLILGSFTLTAVLVVLALVLGIVFGVSLILRRRREKPFRPGAALDLNSPPESPPPSAERHS